MIYRFAEFELDAGARELRKAGERVEAEPKAFDLLVYLLRHCERAVSKDELQNELWPRSIVTETALTRCVMKARRAVDDSATRQRVIRTVHGHGYRFVADLVDRNLPAGKASDSIAAVDGVTAAADAPADGAARPDEATERAPRPPRLNERRRRPTMIAALVALALLVVALPAYFLAGSSGPASDESQSVRTLAVLPVVNRVADEQLAWVRLGLMSLLNRMLQDAGVGVASERVVLSLAADSAAAATPDDALLAQLEVLTGADRMLATTLESRGGLYRLTAVLTAADGRRVRRVIVGATPAALAADLAAVISQIDEVAREASAQRLARVSSDPFINEAYGRALDLELQGKPDEARALFRIAAEQAPELFWLRYEIALCTRDLREWDEAHVQFAALHEEALAAGDTNAILATLNSLAVLHIKRGDYAAAEAPLREALAAADGGDLAYLRATLHVNFGIVAGRLDDAEAAEAHYEQARQEYLAAGLRTPPALLNNSAGMLLRRGELERARDLSEQAVEGFRLRGQRANEASALKRLAVILLRRGDLDGALARHEQAIAIRRDLGDDGGSDEAQAALTPLLVARGDLTRAHVNATQALERAVRRGDVRQRADALAHLAQTARELQQHGEALERYAAARELYSQLNDARGVRAADLGQARALFDGGDAAAAALLAESVLGTAADADDAAALAGAQRLLASVSAAAGDLDAAVARLAPVWAQALERREVMVADTVAAGLAALYLEQNRLDAAEQVLSSMATPMRADRERQRLTARLAYARGDMPAALALMNDLRATAGEAWSNEDNALLTLLNAARSVKP